MATTLAVKYRPQTFEEVCGQSITVTILKKAIETKSFKNCYIFAGKSGCGKTTCARIFAKEINGGIGDPIEIDAASNNGVDNVRAIIDSANQRALAGEYKIFIIDEAHGLTSQAWQAFLKGLEECPKYTIFIFCTTEPQKLPATILNRMQRYNFGPVPQEDIKARLEKICELEGFTNYAEACDALSKLAKGGMRNAISYLEQCAAYSSDLSMSNVKAVLPGAIYETAFKLTWAMKDKDEGKIYAIIKEIYDAGQDLKQFIEYYLGFVIDLNKYILFKSIDATDIPAYLASAENPVVQYTVEDADSLGYFRALADELLEVKFAIRNDAAYRNTVELMLIRFARTH